MGDPWMGQDLQTSSAALSQEQSCAPRELLLLIQVFHLQDGREEHWDGGFWVHGWVGVSNQPPLLGDVERGKIKD